MSPADRNKVLIIGGVAIVAIAAVVFFLVRGRRPAAPAGAAGGFGTEVAQAPGAAAGAGAGAGAAAWGGAATEGVAAAGAEGEVVAEAAPEWVGVISRGRGGDEPSRSDAFLTFEPKIPPPPPELQTPLPVVVPGRIRPEQPAELAVLGSRRVAGVKFNDRPWAILEEGDEIFIVKPGDVVDGLRILAIARRSVYVEDSDGRRWEVPLRGREIAPAAEVRTPGASYVEGMPALPPVRP